MKSSDKLKKMKQIDLKLMQKQESYMIAKKKRYTFDGLELLWECVEVLTDCVALLFSVPGVTAACGGVFARHLWSNNTSPGRKQRSLFHDLILY